MGNLPTNLVTIKRSDGIMDGSLKDPTFRGGGSRKTNIEGELPKKGGALKQFADLRGGEGAWQERGGWCF